ncbi:MAG: hypothetical protein DRH17_02885 [Deltaproteobacteria bacterium]|nr:MAG: hypothetical protein DRH17_02885 [Deltaproteobacteria bacterium]
MHLFLICFLVFFVAALVGPTPKISMAKEASAKNECVGCHTNVKKLIRLSWEIEKIRPKPDKSAETAGEG